MGEIILGLACVLAFMTVVGHGIWVGLAKLFGSGSSTPVRESPLPEKGSCPVCANIMLPHSSGCTKCGWPRGQSLPELDELFIAKRQIQRLAAQEAIDPDTAASMVAAIDLRREELKSGETKRAPAPPTAPEPPAEIAPVVAAEIVTPEIVQPEEAEPVLTPPEPSIELAAPMVPQPTFEVAPAATDPADRVRRYMANQDARTAPIAPAEPRTPGMRPASAPPRLRHAAAWFSAFMDEKNIRWGELIGGLLIVCCSVALVISFWTDIAARPLLKFLVFNGVTAAVFGAGFYTGTRWKLPTTSHGLLVIGTMLVPLNFLAIAAFTADAPPTTILPIAGEIVSVLIFLSLVLWSGRTLAPRWPVTLMLGIMGASTAQLLVRRFIGPGVDVQTLVLVALVPWIVYEASSFWMLRGARKIESFDEPEIAGIFKFIGLTTFAVVPPLGLAIMLRCTPSEVVPGISPLDSLRDLSPLLSLAGVPLLATGLLLWRRVVDRELTGFRTAGTSLAVCGAGVLVGALVLAWPQPARITTLALLDFALLSFLAWRYAMPAAHLAAAGCLAIAWLVGAQGVFGDIPWLASDPRQVIEVILSAASGVRLIPLVLICGGVAAVASWRSAREMARYYGLAAGAAALLSLGLTTWYGFGLLGDPGGATWVYAFYAVAALMGAWGVRRQSMVWIGVVLGLTATVQGIVFGLGESRTALQPWLLAMLAYATLMTLGAMVAAIFGRRVRDLYYEPWQSFALLTSAVALALIASLLGALTAGEIAAYLVWLAAVWLVGAVLLDNAGLFTGFQAAITAALVCAVIGRLQQEGWYAKNPWGWLDPWSLIAQGLALTLLSLFWTSLRIALRRCSVERSWVRHSNGLVNPPWPTFDRFVTALVLIIFVALAYYAALPGALQELTWLSHVNAAGNAVVPDSPVWDLPGLPHQHLFGGAPWALLGMLTLLIVVGFWQGFTRLRVLALLVVTSAACPLLAILVEPDIAVASALRWIWGAWACVSTAKVCMRRYAMPLASRLGWPEFAEQGETIALEAWHWSVAMVGIPLLLITLLVTVRAICGEVVMGPGPGTLFDQLYWQWSYALPLVLLSAALVGYALSERQSSYALGAGLVLWLATSVAFLLFKAKIGHVMSPGRLLQMAQPDAFVLALYALAWIGVVAWLRRRGEASRSDDRWLKIQVAIPVLLNLLLIGLAGGVLFFRAWVPNNAGNAATIFGWGAFALAALARWLLARLRGESFPIRGVFLGLLCVATLTALSVGIGRPQGDWLAYHTLLVGWLLVPWVAMAWAAWRIRHLEGPASLAWRKGTTLGCSLVGAATVALSLRAVVDPQFPWWTCGGLLVACALYLCITLWSYRGGFLYASAALFNMTTAIVWLENMPGSATPFDLLAVNVIALGLPVVLWTWIVLQRVRSAMPAGRPHRGGVHRTCAMLCLLGLGMIAFLELVTLVDSQPPLTTAWLTWSALLATVVAIGACLWDGTQRWQVGGLYVVGLLGVVCALSRFQPPRDLLAPISAVVLSAYGLTTSYLWSRRRGLREFADRLRIPRGPDHEFAGLAWLVPANALLSLQILVLSVRTVLFHDSFSFRVLGANAALVQAVAFALLARGARRSQLQFATLVLGVIGAVLWGWTWANPGTQSADVLHRLIVVTTALGVTAAVYGLALVRLPERFAEWVSAAQRLCPVLVACCLATLLGFLGVEAAQFMDTGAVQVQPWAIALAAVTIVGQFLCCLAAALLPGRDPLGLSERGRTAYVYAAEAMLGLEFLHIRLSMPWMFHGFMGRYWPFIVMGLAFLGVGLSEVFRRQRRMVLAEPLENTGALLPLLPVLGFWVRPGAVSYEMVLLAVGALYATLSVMRRSFGFGILAALAANGGLWYWLGRQDGLGFLEHPQVWLIPPAICVLAAAYLNRDRLTTEQMTSIRYLTSTTIYVSSTADIFLVGVAENPWLSLVLAGLSILGVLAGIALRVRAFLFLGTSFLVLALMTMIWHAAVDLDQTWIWWVSGIVAGVVIIAVFAVFEKKRHDILSLVEKLRDWEA